MAKTLQRLEEVIEGVTVDEKRAHAIFDEVSVQIRKGLVMHSDNPSGFDFSKSDFMMLDSGVEHAPSGQERGVYYGIDMGGTNVRAIRVVLVGHSRVEALSEEAMNLLDVPYAKHLPKGVLDRQATATELFDGVVYAVKKLMIKHGEYDEEAAVKAAAPDAKSSPDNIREVGFTCSFGINQRSLHSAILTQWSKAIETGEGSEKVEDQVIGRDVCALINEAFVRNKINARVNCILNDTISTLISGAFAATDEMSAPSSPKGTSCPAVARPPCMIGAIIGTGFNVCYYEPEAHLYNYVGRVINTECGGLKRAFPRVAADALVDFNSSNPGRQVVEKAVSGLYLGEVVRNMLVEILQVDAPRQLWQQYIIKTQQVAMIYNLKPREASAGDSPLSFIGSNESRRGGSTAAGEDINEFNITNLYTDQALRCVEEWFSRKPSNEELIVVKKVCDAVIQRSGRIVGALLAAFVTKTNHSNGVTIGCDGSLFTKNPKYQDVVNDTMQQLVGSKVKVVLNAVNGGSCIGAALLAACTARHGSSQY